MDYLMGQFIDEMGENGLMNSTVIVITSDHGEELYEHGNVDHGNFYEYTVRVPLLVYLPKLNSKIERNEVVQSIDIAPTIVQLIGVDLPKEWQGNDLFSYSKTMEESENRAYGYSLGSSYVRTQDWKYIKNRNGSEELYYLKKNPKEMQNLESLKRKKVRELSKMMDIWTNRQSTD